MNLIEHVLVNGNHHCNDSSHNYSNASNASNASKDCITHMNKSDIMMNATTGLNNFFNYNQQIENLKHLNENKLKEFYKKYYNNIIFVVSGNFNETEKQELLNLFNNSLS